MIRYSFSERMRRALLGRRGLEALRARAWRDAPLLMHRHAAEDWL